MSAPFVTSLRTGGRYLNLVKNQSGEGEPEVFHLRVQLHDSWDAIRVDVPADEPVRAVKVNALQALDPTALSHNDFFIKLNGVEILNEGESVQEVGAKDGSIFFIHRRRRRAVR